VIWGMKQKENNDIAHINTVLEQKIASYAPKIQRFFEEVNAIVLDKQAQTTLALCCLIAGGHVLFEDLPGLGKTTLASSLAHLAGLKFQRIQFTNDMLASDVIGINMFNQKEHQFEFKQGPIFTQILLADEINRCSPKTQSALLEAMEEGYATIDGVRYALPKPFWVIATQNPLFQSGTYALPGFIQERTPLADRNLLHDIKSFSFTQTQTMRSHRDKYRLYIIRCDKSALLNQGMRLCCTLQGQKATRRKSMTAFTGFFCQIEQIFLNRFTDKYLMRQALQFQYLIFSKNMGQARNQGKTRFLL
jgi:hypothetical protein